MDTAIREAAPQDKISACLSKKRNFLLSGGAGSGKTHTLVETLGQIFNENMDTSVACVTYTNVAANEIKERAPYTNLWVSTIHEFLWREIKIFQKNLICVFDEEFGAEESVDMTKVTKISYQNYRNLPEGIISHNDLIKIAERMFAKYPKLAKIFCDKYDYILIDEYQDTDANVIKIFLSHIKPFAIQKLCVGMFGDKMQSIYNGVEAQDGLGQYVDDFEYIEKSDNYRCSQEVIKLLNEVRDDIKQIPSNKDSDGNITNLHGSAVFVYSHQPFNYDELCKSHLVNGWDFDDPKKTKVLMLTHNLIARHNNFGRIVECYKNCEKTKEYASERLLGGNPDELAKLILRACDLIHMFKIKDYKSLLSEMDLEIKNNGDKGTVSNIFKGIIADTNSTIGAVLEKLNNARIVVSESTIAKYYETDEYGSFFNEISGISLQEAENYYEYYNGLLPFSTQHGVKGAEYDNVLIVLDNGRWNKYNFGYLFEETPNRASVIEATKKIFYVCCSRSKDNLIVFMQSPSRQAILKATAWFGAENCINLDN